MDSKAKVVKKLLADVEKKLGEDMKASLGDYIRLVQLQKELEEDEVREIKVRWVDPEIEATTEPMETRQVSPKPKAPKSEP